MFPTWKSTLRSQFFDFWFKIFTTETCQKALLSTKFLSELNFSMQNVQKNSYMVSKTCKPLILVQKISDLTKLYPFYKFSVNKSHLKFIFLFYKGQNVSFTHSVSHSLSHSVSQSVNKKYLQIDSYFQNLSRLSPLLLF